MRNSNHARTEFAPLNFIETPTVIELDPDSGWIAWDAAVPEFDAPDDRAAQQLASEK